MAPLSPHFVDLLESTNLKRQLSPRHQNQKLVTKVRHGSAETPVKQSDLEGKPLRSLSGNPKQEGGQEGQEGQEEETGGKSNAQLFRELPYSPSIMEFIEKERLGNLPKKRVGKLVKPKDDPNLPEDYDAGAMQVHLRLSLFGN